MDLSFLEDEEDEQEVIERGGSTSSPGGDSPDVPPSSRAARMTCAGSHEALNIRAEVALDWMFRYR